MYSTCLFCHASLGANAEIESFPVGRRLAFDEAKGRLWVVCGKCARWNLTPLEERWEAIEECERHFRRMRARVQTDNIGLAKLKEGLELVRIGQPLRPEFAAWRYGRQFEMRRRRAMAMAGVGAVAAGAVGVAAAPVAGPIVLAGLIFLTVVPGITSLASAPVPVITYTLLPSVTGDGDDMFCFRILTLPPPKGRFQSTSPLVLSMAQRNRLSPSATLTKT